MGDHGADETEDDSTSAELDRLLRTAQVRSEPEVERLSLGAPDISDDLLEVGPRIRNGKPTESSGKRWMAPLTVAAAVIAVAVAILLIVRPGAAPAPASPPPATVSSPSMTSTTAVLETPNTHAPSGSAVAGPGAGSAATENPRTSTSGEDDHPTSGGSAKASSVELPPVPIAGTGETNVPPWPTCDSPLADLLRKSSYFEVAVSYPPKIVRAISAADITVTNRTGDPLLTMNWTIFLVSDGKIVSMLEPGPDGDSTTVGPLKDKTINVPLLGPRVCGSDTETLTPGDYDAYILQSATIPSGYVITGSGPTRVTVADRAGG